MRSFFDWWREEQPESDKPWLVLGKGPSFAKRGEYDLGSFHTLSLNHAVREQKVTLAHVIDADVVSDCADVLESNAGALVMPWVPHVRNVAGSHTLEELARTIPVLRRMEEQGRLLCYNLSSAPPRDDTPVIQVAWFSAEAALRLLAHAGVSRVRSLGIDGGAAYSADFDDLKDKTLLANGHENFDRQFEEIAKIIRRTGMDYAPLDLESPARVYVGCTEDQMLSVKVLEYSIRKYASMSVEVFPLHLAPVETPRPKDEKNAPRTPFSFQRFLIPELAGYRGRAVYVDSDMQLFKDIRRLWAVPFNGAELLTVRRPDGEGPRLQFSVMLLNCDSLRWDIREIVVALDQGELNYERLMHEMRVAKGIRADISPEWNSLDTYEEGRTALLHYTNMPTQPWVCADNPDGHLWARDLFEAIDEGFITSDYVREHVARGYVRPSLLYQIEHRVEDGLLLPRKARALDATFVAPYRLLPHVAAAAPARQQALFGARARRRLRSAFRYAKERASLRRLARSARHRTRSLLGQ